MMYLTLQEKRALYGLVTYPEMSLKSIAEQLEMNYWTLYKIREKMKERNLLREVVIPNYKALGYELLVAGYGSITKERMKMMEKLEKVIKKAKQLPRFSGIFYAFAETYRGFVLGAVKNYTEIVKNLLYVDRLVGIREILARERPKVIILPYEITEIPVLFDYSRLMAREFNMPMPPVKKVRTPEGKLSFDELRVLKKLVEKPEASIKQLSQWLGIGRQKISRIKDKLFSEGWCYRRIIPDVKMLGYEVIVFAHWESNPTRIENFEEKKIETLGIDLSRIIFLAYNLLEGFVIALFKNLKESRNIVSLFSTFMERENVLLSEPEILFLSLEEGVTLRDHEHAYVLSPLP